MRTLKRKSYIGLTWLDNINAAVKELLDEDDICHAVAKTRNISEAIHCDDIARKCAQAEELKRSDTRKTDACSTQHRRKVLLHEYRRRQTLVLRYQYDANSKASIRLLPSTNRHVANSRAHRNTCVRLRRHSRTKQINMAKKRGRAMVLTDTPVRVKRKPRSGRRRWKNHTVARTLVPKKQVKYAKRQKHRRRHASA